MPFALLIALVASLGIHSAFLFLPEVNLATELQPMPLTATLKTLPPPQPQEAVAAVPVEAPKAKAKPKKSVVEKRRTPRRKAQHTLAPSPLLNVPVDTPDAVQVPVAPASEEARSEQENGPGAPATGAESDGEANADTAGESVTGHVPNLPEHGRISYRLDRGDSGFEIGVARQEWDIIDGLYRLRSTVETTGLVWLFKSIRIVMESRGSVTSKGLRPDSFVISRNGQEAREKASFDWDHMTVTIGDRLPQPVAEGAQDLLSFNYQLRSMALPDSGGTLLLATGRKYGAYQLEVVGDEEIVIPAGTLRTRHLRAPGVNTTELWLAYDYLLLPVKIRHVDNKGDSLVQVATEIQLSLE